MTTVTFPPGPSAPRFVQGAYALAVPHRWMRRLRGRFGDAFTISVPVFGRVVVISNPAEVKQLFLAGPDVADNLDRNLGWVLGPGSLFALTGEEHRKQRRLLVPPFHGRRLGAYEKIVEEETVRELASWPQGRAFATLPSMMRITLNAILRAVFGAEGAEFDRLRELLPPFVRLASRLMAVPVPQADWGRWSPWGRFWAMRRDYDAVVERLITAAERDAGLGERDDVLALMLQSRHGDGSGLSHGEIADELLTLLTAGHETTATTLAWAVERLRRHPAVLRELAEEADAGGTAFREATILEVQRTRPVIDMVPRQVKGRQPAARTVDAAEGLLGPGKHLPYPRRRIGLPGRAWVRAVPVPRRQAGPVPVDSVRRRRPALSRRGVRDHGDERRAAHHAARVLAGADERTRRAMAFAWHRQRAGEGRPGGRSPPGHPGGAAGRGHGRRSRATRGHLAWLTRTFGPRPGTQCLVRSIFLCSLCAGALGVTQGMRLFLHLSKEEQRRFFKRLGLPEKNWKSGLRPVSGSTSAGMPASRRSRKCCRPPASAGHRCIRPAAGLRPGTERPGHQPGIRRTQRPRTAKIKRYGLTRTIDPATSSPLETAVPAFRHETGAEWTTADQATKDPARPGQTAETSPPPDIPASPPTS